eukprot:SAG22_NODE_1347_length_4669_cov_12.718381_1_plen_357_part_00
MMRMPAAPRPPLARCAHLRTLRRCCRASSSSSSSSSSSADPAAAPWVATDGLQGRIFNPAAMAKLEREGTGGGPVLLIDLVKLRTPQPPKQSDWKAGLKRPAAEAWSLHCDRLAAVGAAGGHGYKLKLALKPHRPHGVLNGNPGLHAYDEIRITEYANAAAAHACLTDPECAALRDEAIDLPSARGALSTSDGYGHGAGKGGSVVLLARPSTAFAKMPTFEEGGGEKAAPVADPAVPPPPVAAVPFAGESNASRQNWEALATRQTQHMYAFNLLRTPEAEKYKRYSAHFADLPAKYGMRFVEVGAMDSSDPDDCVLLGQPPGQSNGGSLGFDLMAAVYFPSSACAHLRSSPVPLPC